MSDPNAGRDQPDNANAHGVDSTLDDRCSAATDSVKDAISTDTISTAQLIDLERAQIGHDLHDLLLPLIFAASANLQSVMRSLRGSADGSGVAVTESAANEVDGRDSGELAVSSDLYHRIEQAEQWAREALLVGRNLLGEIYPPELTQLSWLAAARDAATRVAGQNSEVIWKVDADSPVCDPQWNRDVAAVAYRILVEALRNAVRHGKAETIAIRCEREQMLIVDDGQGFDPNTVPPDRYGIRTMKGRAQLVGKSLTIESTAGGPTCVRLPL